MTETQAKDAINGLVILDSALRKAEVVLNPIRSIKLTVFVIFQRSSGQKTVFPALIDAVETLSKVTSKLQTEGSLYGEEFTSPTPLQKRWQWK